MRYIKIDVSLYTAIAVLPQMQVIPDCHQPTMKSVHVRNTRTPAFRWQKFAKWEALLQPFITKSRGKSWSGKSSSFCQKFPNHPTKICLYTKIDRGDFSCGIFSSPPQNLRQYPPTFFPNKGYFGDERSLPFDFIAFFLTYWFLDFRLCGNTQQHSFSDHLRHYQYQSSTKLHR